MLEFFKEGAETWLQRVRSPLIGSVALSFLAINWQPIFFVIFADVPVLERFSYFDCETSIVTLVLLPVLVGLLIGLATPFVNYFGSRIAKNPVEKLRLLQAESADSVLKRKAELGAEREIAFAEFKQAALKNAQATQAIENADLDAQTREALDKKVAVNSKEVLSDEDAELAKLSDLQRCALMVLSENGGANFPSDRVWESVLDFDENLEEFYADFGSIRLKVDVAEALDGLKSRGLTESVYNSAGPDGLRLSAKGYRVFDAISPS